MFVLWYCHKRGREVRLEKERPATEGEASALASSASSLTDDDDSVFGDKTKAKPTSKSNTEFNNSKEEEEQEPPPVISDGEEDEAGNPSARIEDLPSVKDLPDPGSAKEHAKA